MNSDNKSTDTDRNNQKISEALERDNINTLNQEKYSITFTKQSGTCPYCKECNIDVAENVEQMSDSVIWVCHECVMFFEVDDKGNISIEEGSSFGQNILLSELSKEVL